MHDRILRVPRSPASPIALALASALAAACASAAAGGSAPEPASGNAVTDTTSIGAGEPQLAEVTVTAQRVALLGVASTASEGIVSDEELRLTPTYRPGQLLETVPGLIVTLHSGEGKANQFLLRGYNLEHGTDLATLSTGCRSISRPMRTDRGTRTSIS